MEKTYYISKKEKGGAIIFAVFLFLIIGIMIISGFSFSVSTYIKNLQSISISEQSYYTAESGLEDVWYRFKNGIEVGDEEILNLVNQTATTTIISTDKQKFINSYSEALDGSRNHLFISINIE
jgi:UDP:flavonoid glycosyltransferase YjiC (YdhE family)